MPEKMMTRQYNHSISGPETVWFVTDHSISGLALATQNGHQVSQAPDQKLSQDLNTKRLRYENFLVVRIPD